MPIAPTIERDPGLTMYRSDHGGGWCIMNVDGSVEPEPEYDETHLKDWRLAELHGVLPGETHLVLRPLTAADAHLQVQELLPNGYALGEVTGNE